MIARSRFFGSAAAAGVVLPPLYRSAVRRLLRLSVRRVNAGDPALLFATYARDVRFVFPGESSWAGDYRGREQVQGFVRRFIDAGLALEPTDILVDGPPWNTRVCLRFVDRAKAPDGTLVYENEGVILIRLAWGRLRHYESHEDTQKVAEFDRWLAARREPREPRVQFAAKCSRTVSSTSPSSPAAPLGAWRAGWKRESR